MTTVHAYTNDQNLLDAPAQGRAPGPLGGGQHHPDDHGCGPGGGPGRARSSPGASTASRCGCRSSTARSSTSACCSTARSPSTRSTPRSRRRRAQGSLAGRLRYTTEPFVSVRRDRRPRLVRVRLRPDPGRRAASSRSSAGTTTSGATPAASLDLTRLVGAHTTARGREPRGPDPRPWRPGRRHGGGAAVDGRLRPRPARPGFSELRIRAHGCAGGGRLSNRRPCRSGRTSRSAIPTW